LKAEAVVAAEQFIEGALASVVENFASVNWMHGLRLLFKKVQQFILVF
jgi:hypothetical protein